jgi:LCP family protein required for cell wall assembly
MKKILPIINIIISIILLIELKKLNILPNKYLIIILIITILLNIVGILLTKYAKKLNIILYIILIITELIGLKYIYNTKKYFKQGFNNNYEINEYNIIVLKKSKYETLEDLNNRKIGYIKNELEQNNYLEEIKIEKTLQEYENMNDLYKELLNKKIDAIVIDKSYISILEEYNNIEEKTKIIYSYSIKKEKQIKKETNLKPINIYISGSDSRSGIIEAKSRTDVNMIMTINPETKKILLTSIPRDYYVRLHNTNGLKDKLTHSGIYGIEMSKQTIEDLFDIKIDYVIKVGFESVISIVDTIGGIDIESDKTFTTHCKDGGAVKTQVVKGMNHFNGAQALSYARERYAYIEGDNHRILNQQQVLEAIIKKIYKDKNLVYKYNEFLTSFKKLYRTDINEELIKKYIKNSLEKQQQWEIKTQVVTGTGAMGETYSMPGMNLYIMIPNQESIKNAKENIEKVKK